MKKIFGLIIAASTLVGFTACSDFLDEDTLPRRIRQQAEVTHFL